MSASTYYTQTKSNSQAIGYRVEDGTWHIDGYVVQRILNQWRCSCKQTWCDHRDAVISHDQALQQVFA
jgi:hypothetical protein